MAGATPYADRAAALSNAQARVTLIVRGLTLLYGAVGGFGLSTLTGLVGALLDDVAEWAVSAAKLATVLAGGFGLVCLLVAALTFILESRCTIGLLRLGTPKPTTSGPARKVEGGV